MRGFFLKIDQFIRGIRHSDDRTKKRWLVIFSSILMVFVIALWIVYLGIVLPKNSDVSEATSTEGIAPPAQGDTNSSFFSTLGTGMDIIWENIRKSLAGVKDSAETEWSNVKNLFGRTNELDIEKPKDGN